MRYIEFSRLAVYSMAVLLAAFQAVGEDTATSPAALLDALQRVVEKPAFRFDSSGGLSSPEYRAVCALGVPILPELVQRLSKTNDLVLLGMYTSSFGQIAHFTPYYYTSVSQVAGGMDSYDADQGNLPFLSIQSDGKSPDTLGYRDKQLIWWEKLNKENHFEERITAMRALAGKLSPDGANMTGTDYRAFYRANCNYGIFNLPVYITLIRKDNNPLAFMEFLCVSSHPVYKALMFPGDVVGRMKVITTTYPTQERRVALVEEWWAENAAKYECLPALAKAIDQAVKN